MFRDSSVPCYVDLQSCILLGAGFFSSTYKSILAMAWNFVGHKMAVFSKRFGVLIAVSTVAPSGSQRRVLRASRPLAAMLQVIPHVTSSCVSSLLLASCSLLSALHGLPSCIIADDVFTVGSFPGEDLSQTPPTPLQTPCLTQ